MGSCGRSNGGVHASVHLLPFEEIKWIGRFDGWKESLMAPGTALHEEVREPAPARRRVSLWWRITGTWFPPLVALLSGWTLLAYRSGKHGMGLFLPSTWAQYDSGHYLAIARNGYMAEACTKGYVSPKLPPVHYYLCGNAGWLPGYPVATRVLSRLVGLSVPIAALIVAWICWYLVLLLMWRLLADTRSRPSRWVCLLIAAFFPGQVYFAALFPISLCIAGLLGCLFAVLRGSRLGLAGVAFLSGFVAAYSYITAIAVVPALLVTAFLAMRGRHRLRALIPALGIVAGFGAVLLTMRQATGFWNAYFLTVQKYQVGVHSPLETLQDRLRPLWTSQPARLQYQSYTASQTLLALCLVLLAVVVTLGWAARRPAPGSPTESAAKVENDKPPAHRPSRYTRWSRALTSRLSAFDLTFLLAAVGVWLVPYIASGQASTYRSEAFVILTVPLLRRLPSWLLIIPLAASVFVAWHMAPYFFNGRLV
jgi:hypothetical protein